MAREVKPTTPEAEVKGKPEETTQPAAATTPAATVKSKDISKKAVTTESRLKLQSGQTGVALQRIGARAGQPRGGNANQPMESTTAAGPLQLGGTSRGLT